MPKPTSNLIIRAINESSSTAKTGLMRKITVNVTPNNKPEVTNSTSTTSGTKRKSKSSSDLQPDTAEAEPEVKPKRNKQSDKRVFVTKREDSPQANLVEKIKTDDHVTSKNGKRAKSPKFFVTLHEPDKKKEKRKGNGGKGSKEMIINPRDSEDDSDDPESVNDVNHISAISAEKIKKQQEQNNQQLNNINNQE